MPTSAEREAIEKLIAGPPTRLYVAATGAGASFQGRLWSVPGISSVLVGGAFPYDQDATVEFLGYRPEKFVSEETAIDMAMVSYMKALTSKREGAPIGIGITASVAGTREHRGDHRACIAVRTANEPAFHYTLILKKGVGYEARQKDEEIVTNVAMSMLFSVAKISFSGERTRCRSCDGTGTILVGPDERDYPCRTCSATGVIDGEESGVVHVTQDLSVFLARPYFRADGRREETPKSGGELLLVPGAFNPVHFGHFGMAEAAEKASGRRATYYVTMKPPHKETISVSEALARIPQFRGRDLLFGYDDALYLDKARKFPGASFVIGTDAMDRMLDPKWYRDGGRDAVLDMIFEFSKLGCRFYVADRIVDGKLLTINEVAYKRNKELAPSGLLSLEAISIWTPIPGSWDISSTEIRAGSVG